MSSAQTVEEKKKEFEEISIKYMNSLYNSAIRLTRDGSEAQDLVQDTYLRAYRFFDKFEKGTNFKAWLFKILKNIYINKYRKQQKIPQMVEVSNVESTANMASDVTPEDEVFGDLLDDDISKAMDSLPEEFRITIVLSDLEGFTYKEISDILNCPIGTVMSRLHRGRGLLKESLREYARKRGYVKD
jgi:RNA polymerase sigma-70 factor (ECF subfamily)